VLVALGLFACGSDEPNTQGWPDASVDNGTDASVSSASDAERAEAADAACVLPNVTCGATCVDPRTDPDHCGACDSPCFGVTQCIDGVCLAPCAPDQTRCVGKCVPLATDNANCGKCGNACETGKVCSGKACTLECGAPLVTCYGQETVDGGTDAQAADAADAQAADAADAQAADAADAQAADAADAGAADATDAGAADAADAMGPKGARYCADLQSDEVNCGRCGQRCRSGEQCASGACRATCASGQTDCGGTCRDLTTDLTNCGTCGHPCSTGLVCSSSICQATCAPPFSKCGDRCANTDSDRSHCGGCAAACTGDELCLGGACRIPCPTGQSLCGDKRCHDVLVDDLNCGVCGKICGQRERCAAGACVKGALPRSCVDALDVYGPLPDGDYTIDPDGPGPVRPFVVHCAAMSTGSPKEYLTFARSAVTGNPDSNAIVLGGGGACNCASLRRSWTRIAIDVSTMTIDLSDKTFSSPDSPDAQSCWDALSGSCGDAGRGSPFGVAYDCVGMPNATGLASVDLRGTGFSIDPSVVYVVDGFLATGGSAFDQGRTRVDATGGGFCGSAHPAGPFVLKQD
jgi:hypothetical protein